MMGHRQVEQAALFYAFSLENHVPPDHLLRSIDRFVDVGELLQRMCAQAQVLPERTGPEGVALDP
jgi:hypothetical protein